MNTTAFCAPADCTEIAAVYFLNRLIIRAKGNKPTPCHSVRIRQLPIDIFPPEFAVEVCDPGDFCIQVITPFDVVDAFFAPRTDTVKVHCSGGVKTVPVRIVKGDAGTGLRLDALDASPSAKREATGYSQTFDFREAFGDAIRRLPPDPHPFPDKLTTVRVTETGALFGGIAGLHKMYVRVEAE